MGDGNIPHITKGFFMKVRATQVGYIYHRRRREGEVFELKTIKGHKQDKDGRLKPIEITPEQQFSARWMEVVDGNYDEKEMMHDDQSKRRKKKVEHEAFSSDDEVI